MNSKNTTMNRKTLCHNNPNSKGRFKRAKRKMKRDKAAKKTTRKGKSRQGKKRNVGIRRMSTDNNSRINNRQSDLFIILIIRLGDGEERDDSGLLLCPRGPR